MNINNIYMAVISPLQSFTLCPVQYDNQDIGAQDEYIDVMFDPSGIMSYTKSEYIENEVSLDINCYSVQNSGFRSRNDVILQSLFSLYEPCSTIIYNGTSLRVIGINYNAGVLIDNYYSSSITINIGIR